MLGLVSDEDLNSVLKNVKRKIPEAKILPILETYKAENSSRTKRTSVVNWWGKI
jgi:ribosomal protein S21